MPSRIPGHLVRERIALKIKLEQVVELSHRLVPGQEEFPLEIETFNTDEVMANTERSDDMRIERREDIWYILQEVKMGSHVGTHVEFPYHHLKDGKSAADYPLDRLVGDAVLLDFSHKKAGEAITRQEVIDLGIEIRPGDIVLIRTDMHMPLLMDGTYILLPIGMAPRHMAKCFVTNRVLMTVMGTIYLTFVILAMVHLRTLTKMVFLTSAILLTFIKKYFQLD